MEAGDLKSSKRLRWWIAWTLFCSTVINYISRQTLSVLAPVIMKQFHMTHADYSHIVFAFQFSHAVMWLLGGVFIDLIGTRLGLTLAVLWWSASGMFHALANSVHTFEIFRFMLGIGEGCNWPGASKAVAEWFPAQERGMAVAIFDSGASVGAIIATPLVSLVAYALGWRSAFIASGLLGFLWLLLWLSVYHPLQYHPRVTREERTLIGSGRTIPAVSTQMGIERWLTLLKDSNVWGIVVGRSLTDQIWWFYVFWLPQYLSEARGFGLKQIAFFAWIPFLTAFVGNFSGGFASGWLIRRGIEVVRARKLVCIVSTLPILAGIPAALTHNVYWAMVLISISTWAYASWSTMGLTLPSDLFPHDVVATVTGLSGLGAGLTGVAFTLLIGVLIDKFSYFPAFLAAGTLPILATVSILILIRQSRPF